MVSFLATKWLELSRKTKNLYGSLQPPSRPRAVVQTVRSEDFGFEVQDSSNFKFLLLSPPQYLEHIRIIIRPRMDPGRLLNSKPILIFLEQAQCFCVLCSNDKMRSGFQPVLPLFVVADQRFQRRISHRGAYEAFHIHVSIRDVEHEQSVRLELRQVHLDCFTRNQVSGNGIGVEGVQHQHVEHSIVHSFDRHAAIAKHDVAVLCTSTEEGEVFTRNVVDLWIDVEERYVPVRSRPAGHAARTQSHNSNLLVRPSAEHFHDITHRSRLVIVRKRLSHEFSIQTLETV